MRDLSDVAAIVLVAPAIMVIAFHDLPFGHSFGHNVIWYESFRQALAEGEIYPRWLPGLWHGAGAADFFFYAPLPFWLAAAVEELACRGCAPVRVVNLSAVVTLAMSGLAFRHLALRVGSRCPALLGAVLYMLLPYHLIDWFDRQSIGEFMAYVFLPIQLAAVLDWRAGRPAPLRLALATGLLCLAHLPSVVVSAVFLVVLAPVLMPRDRWRSVAGAGAAAFAGIGIAAVYWLPALALMDTVDVRLLEVEEKLRDLMLSPSNWPPADEFYRSLLPGFLVTVALSLGGAVLLWRRVPAVARIGLAAVAIAVLVSLPLSYLLWQVPPFRDVQFPFRYFVLTDLAAALVAAALVERIARRETLVLPAVLVAGAFLAVLWLHPLNRPSQQIRMFEWQIEADGGAFEWLPKPLPGESWPREHHVEALAGRGLVEGPASAEIRVLEETARRVRFEADLPEPGTVVLKRTWWPFWRLTEEDSGRAIPLGRSEGFPLIAARLPAGTGSYALELPRFAVERAGATLSLLSFLIALGWQSVLWRRALRPR